MVRRIRSTFNTFYLFLDMSISSWRTFGVAHKYMNVSN